MVKTKTIKRTRAPRAVPPPPATPVSVKILDSILVEVDAEAALAMQTRTEFIREALKERITRLRKNRAARKKEFTE